MIIWAKISDRTFSAQSWGCWGCLFSEVSCQDGEIKPPPFSHELCGTLLQFENELNLGIQVFRILILSLLELEEIL